MGSGRCRGSIYKTGRDPFCHRHQQASQHPPSTTNQPQELTLNHQHPIHSSYIFEASSTLSLTTYLFINLTFYERTEPTDQRGIHTQRPRQHQQHQQPSRVSSTNPSSKPYHRPHSRPWIKPHSRARIAACQRTQGLFRVTDTPQPISSPTANRDRFRLFLNPSYYLKLCRELTRRQHANVHPGSSSILPSKHVFQLFVSRQHQHLRRCR